MVHLDGAAKQRFVKHLFSEIAVRYNLMNDLMTAGLHRSWKRQTAQVATRGLTGKALDIATGTGDLAQALARCQGIEYVVGVDILPEMLSIGQNKVHNTGKTARIGLLLGDALNLPFINNSFDCATASFSLRNMPNLGQALAEMVRVVRPGGRVTTLELTPMPHGRSLWFVRWYFHRIVPLLGQIVAGNRSAYTYLPDSADVFLEPHRLSELFREAGLTNTGYRRLGFGAVTIHWGQRPLL
jgi:demethylmenaquinone methyltransferase/2-methoxy-6-polyprenyl-1,4-benzoquinol methylase